MEKNNLKTQKTLTQQIFHIGLFEARPRSSSFSGLPSDSIQPEESNQTQTVPNTASLIPAEKQDPTPQNQPCNEWQQDRASNKKRKRHDSPTESINKQLNTGQERFKVPVHNQFEILSDDEETESINKNKEYIPKPEPIFVTGVVDITPLRELIAKVVDINNLTMTTLRSGHIIKLMPADIQSYKILRDNLIKNNINHYTYKLKCERAYRVVIRGLHATEDTNMIKDELQAKGHAIRQIVNVLHRTTKEKLPLYFIDLEPQVNNKDIFNIKYINHVKVTIQAPYKKKEVLQCKRCQRFGHSKNQCFRPFRCVKCGSDHPTSSCTKRPDTEAECANCLGKHPASYKGCIKYKQYKERILKLKPPVQQTKNSNNEIKEINTDQTQHNSCIYETIKQRRPSGLSYASVLKGKQNITANPITQTHQLPMEASQQNITSLMEKMFDRFQLIMKDMMDRMFDQMIKIITQMTTAQKA